MNSQLPTFTDCMWPLTMNTSENDVVAEFFKPALERAVRYDRGVGFFSSGWFRINSQGMIAFAAHGGKARWITSPILSKEDWEALCTGEAAKVDATLLASLKAAVADFGASLNSDTRNALAWMVADGIIEFRLAVPRGHLDDGDFHDKFGVFTDSEDHQMSFNCSYNDSVKGLRNYESFKVFRSWEPAFKPLVDSDDARFEKLWQNGDPNLRVFTLPEAIRKDIVELRTSERPYGTQSISKPERYPLWRHQERALEEFLAAKRGVVEMATGTGKTRLALALSDKLIRENEIETIIIAADGNDLLDQWQKQLLNLVRGRSESWAIVRHYDTFRERDQFLLTPTQTVLLTSRHFLPAALKGLDSTQKAKTLLIHDEVHRLGSPSNREELAGLSEGIKYCLGLSATPEREYDADGNIFIEAHIGKIIYRFPIEEAIQQRILSPFDYHPIVYTPDQDDGNRTKQVYRLQAARKAAGNPMSLAELWTELAKIHKTSRAKLAPFAQFIAVHEEMLERCIVFVETQEYGEAVLEIIHGHRHDFHTYYADDDSANLEAFARGDIQCLLTCHRLSEGIDIQSLKTVVLFSSARSRLETIQRMGRCLRTDPNNPAKRANIVDFIRSSAVDNADTERRQWLTALSQIRPN